MKPPLLRRLCAVSAPNREPAVTLDVVDDGRDRFLRLGVDTAGAPRAFALHPDVACQLGYMMSGLDRAQLELVAEALMDGAVMLWERR